MNQEDKKITRRYIASPVNSSGEVNSALHNLPVTEHFFLTGILILTEYLSNRKFIVPLGNQRLPSVSPWTIIGVLGTNKLVITPDTSQ
jgi:hypothetical protein